jgi:hypothetical protein
LSGQGILEHTSEDIKRQLRDYQLQLPLFHIMQGELRKAQRTIVEALKCGELLSSEASKYHLLYYEWDN